MAHYLLDVKPRPGTRTIATRMFQAADDAAAKATAVRMVAASGGTVGDLHRRYGLDDLEPCASIEVPA